MANNNYDRMKMGENAQPTPAIPNKAKQNKAKRQTRAAKIAMIPVSLCLVVLFLGLVGGLGAPAKAALLGVFGWAGVAYSLLGVGCAILVWTNFRLKPIPDKKKRNKRTILMIGVVAMAVIIMLFLQIITTISAYNDVSSDGFAKYGDYLGSVYRHGEETAGGALAGVFSHWMLAYMGARIAEIVLAILFFAILLGMIYPFWFVEKKERVISDEGTLTSSDGADHTKLFVDTIDGGEPEKNRVKRKDKKKTFDYTFPNNQPIADEVSEVDTPDDGDAQLAEIINSEPDPKNRKQMAAEFLFSNSDRRADELFGASTQKEYDAADDKDGPLYFKEKNLYAEWGKRDALPEQERKQNSADILFGDINTQATPMPTPSVKRSPETSRTKLESGTTVETIRPRGDNLPRKRKDAPASFAPLSPAKEEPKSEPLTSNAFGGWQQPNPQTDLWGNTPASDKPTPAQPLYGQSFAQPQQAPIEAQQPYGAEYRDKQAAINPQTPNAPQPQRPSGQGYQAPTSTYAQAPVQPQAPTAPYGQAGQTPSQPIYGQAGQTPYPQQQAAPAPVYGQPVGQSVPLSAGNAYVSQPKDNTGVSDHLLTVEEAQTVTPREYPPFAKEERVPEPKPFGYKRDPGPLIEPKPAPLYQPAPAPQEEPVEEEIEEVYEPAPLFAEREEVPEDKVYGGFVERRIEPKPEPVSEEPAAFEPRPATAVKPVVKEQAKAYAPAKPQKPKPYQYPPLHLLKDYPPPMDMENYEKMYSLIEEAFSSFGISVQVLGHTRGPTYTQYAVQLADGISVKRVNTLEEDIVRKLRLNQEITIVPSVPGMDAIGVEVVNKTRATVSLKPLLTDPCFHKDKKLYFVLGVDVRGEPFYCDILNGPHMLIAGSSGSGKSVCLNTLICSLLFNYSPEYVKFILIDPKGGVEMEIYNDVPHNLLGKAATNPSSTIKALDWAIDEMERRYSIMKDEGVRNIGSYNDIIVERGQQRLPYILVIIDELADMMKMSKKMATDLEQRIARLTAKARACGIHVIVATQRPSVDVITGTIKNNIPTRIAFRTASQIDSKTILNKGCADKLYGRGDMYYMGNGVNDLKRLQAPMLSDEEVGEVTDYIRDHNEAQVDASITNIIFREDEDEQVVEDMGLTPTNIADGTPGKDAVFEQAVRFAAQQGVVSISKLQREFRLGFSRAGFLVDEMEKRGIIEPAVPGSSRPRRVVMTLQQINDMFGGGDDE